MKTTKPKKKLGPEELASLAAGDLPPELRILLEEVAKRQVQQQGVEHTEAALIEELFDKQQEFYRDASRRKAVLGSRRAGKTELWCRIATIAALKNPRGLVRVWHSSRLRAKDMLWMPLQYALGRHGINFKANETELTLTFDNGAVIKLVGADKDKEAQKKRGDKTVLEIILEAQNFGAYLRSMVEDVIDPSLLDNLGTLCLEGTPGALCQGFWFQVSGGGPRAAARWRSEDGEWSCHRWTMLDNPHLPHAQVELTRIKKSRRWADDNPTYLREWCGTWVNDLTALFYKFDLVRNTFSFDDLEPWGPGWQHSLGWDLGFRDDMAIVIWGWHPDKSDLYEVFSWKEPGALAERVMTVMNEQEASKKLNLVAQVADMNGGGRMYVEEVMSRWSRHFDTAKKTEKYEHVRLFNDELLTGHIKLRRGSPLQLEMAGLMRDPDWPPADKPEAPPREEPSHPNHNSDAALYAWRACWHYFKAPKKETKVHSADAAWGDDYVKRLDKRLQKRKNEDTIDYGFGAEGDND